MTMAIPKPKLITLLKDSAQHLESSDDFSPILYETLAALHQHAFSQIATLQTQITALQAEQEVQRQNLQHAEQASKEAMKLSNSSTKSSISESKHQKQQVSGVELLEQQKKAAAEKRRLEVIEKRRKAAEEQKKKEQEEKRKFLEYEQRKINLKSKAKAGKPLPSDAESLADRMKNEMSALNIGKQEASDEVGTQGTPTEVSEAATKDSPEQVQRKNEPKRSKTEAEVQPSSRPQQTQQQAQQQQETKSPAKQQAQKQKQQRTLQQGQHQAEWNAAQQQPYQHQQAWNQKPAARPNYPQPASSVPSNQSQTQQHPHPSQQPPHHAPTGVDMKYRNMSQQTQQDDSPSMQSALKRNILLNWALQPPAYQILRTIDELLCSIHMVYPPAFGLSAHSYFESWKLIPRADICCNTSGQLDDEKIKKAVRKLRFFLHPDKLPRDLSGDQAFTCKLLWDVTNDAFEDYKTSRDTLDWLQ